ncbi:MAG: c-type cytochrome biogenesis protein CcmI [Silicimonas sp.]|jgi:cytochrome c-type biogenesis protein CcmH|nr:c-type cytochrome biogenesis protein CcmI [Silicimonas sp.]
MTFWILASLIALSVALWLINGLRLARGNRSEAESDMGVYRDQLAEVDRDLARRVLTETEAETIRTEVARRLLDADRRANATAGEDRRGHATPAIAAVVAVLFLGSVLLYTRIGAPGYPDLPMAERLADIRTAAANRMGQDQAEALALPNIPAGPDPDARYLELMENLRAVLKERPDDLRGLALLAENEARLGNFKAAREAQERILAIKGDDADPVDILGAIDILVFAAGGYVSPEAETLIQRLNALEPESGAALYYSGLTLAQNGRPDQAFPIWRRLLEQGPRDAPWVPIIAREIAGVAADAGIRYQPPDLSGPDAAAMAAADAMSDEDRQAMIEGMVEGLAARLASEGGPAEDWARLITALGVLGQRERAEAIVSEARTVFAGRDADLARIDAAASQAGLSQ